MIAIIGDLHNSYKKVFKFLNSSTEIEFCLQIGDLGKENQPYPDFPIPTYFIQGNHENWDAIEKIKENQGPKNLHFLENGNLYDIRGLKILALGGNYAPSKFKLKRKDLTGDLRRHFVNDEITTCCTYKDVDIFLTHEAPSPYYKFDRNIGNSSVSQIIKATNPKLHVFGHHHYYSEYIAVPNTKSLGLTYGFNQIILFDNFKLTQINL